MEDLTTEEAIEQSHALDGSIFKNNQKATKYVAYIKKVIENLKTNNQLLEAENDSH